MILATARGRRDGRDHWRSGGTLMDLTRRRTIAGLVAVPALTLAPFAPTQAASSRLAAFRALSARLTGFDIDDIHPDRALGIVEALLVADEGPALDRLLAGKDGGDTSLAARIAEAWYLGLHPGPQHSPARLFHAALVWRALDFTQPPGLCDSAPGAWQQPPSTAP